MSEPGQLDVLGSLRLPDPEVHLLGHLLFPHHLQPLLLDHLRLLIDHLPLLIHHHYLPIFLHLAFQPSKLGYLLDIAIDDAVPLILFPPPGYLVLLIKDPLFLDLGNLLGFYVFEGDEPRQDLLAELSIQPQVQHLTLGVLNHEIEIAVLECPELIVASDLNLE